LNLVKGGITEKYQKGDFIYKQNDKPDYIYLLKEGVIECYNQTKLDLYESFIEYIHDGENSLLKDIDDPLLWKEDKISQKIIQGYEDLENMRFSLQKLNFQTGKKPISVNILVSNCTDYEKPQAQYLFQEAEYDILLRKSN
jgi:hypothetical protein